MIKIDTVLSGKADNSQGIKKTLFSSQWINTGSISIQKLEIEGLTETQNGVIGAAQHLSQEQIDAVRAAGLYVSEQEDGYLTIASDGETPPCDIPVVLILLG